MIAVQIGWSCCALDRYSTDLVWRGETSAAREHTTAKRGGEQARCLV